MGELGGVIPGTFLFEFFVLTSMRGLNIFRKTLLIFILAESTVWLKNNITYSTLHLQERHNYAESTIYVELGTRDNCCHNLTSFTVRPKQLFTVTLSRQLLRQSDIVSTTTNSLLSHCRYIMSRNYTVTPRDKHFSYFSVGCKLSYVVALAMLKKCRSPSTVNLG